MLFLILFLVFTPLCFASQSIVALDSDQLKQLLEAIAGPSYPNAINVDLPWLSSTCPFKYAFVSVSNTTVKTASNFRWKSNTIKWPVAPDLNMTGIAQGVDDQIYVDGVTSILPELFELFQFHTCLVKNTGRIWTFYIDFLCSGTSCSNPGPLYIYFQSTNTLPHGKPMPMTSLHNWLTFQAMNVFKTLDFSDPKSGFVQLGMQELAWHVGAVPTGIGNTAPFSLNSCHNFSSNGRQVYHSADYVTFYGYSDSGLAVYSFRNPGIHFKVVDEEEGRIYRPDYSIDSVNLFNDYIVSNWPDDVVPVGMVYHNDLATTNDFVSAGYRVGGPYWEGCKSFFDGNLWGSTIPLSVNSSERQYCGGHSGFDCGFSTSDGGTFRSDYRMALDVGVLGRDVYTPHLWFASLNSSTAPLIVKGPAIHTFLGQAATAGPYRLSELPGSNFFGVISSLAPQPLREQLLAIEDTFDVYYKAISDAWETYQEIEEITTLIVGFFAEIPF
jgi:hypothetical protein